MSKTLAKIVSYLFHPLMMPSLGIIYLFYNGSYISMMPGDVKKIILLVISANTLGLPLLIIPLFYHFGVIRSYSMETHRERILPLAFTLIPYMFSVYFIYRIPIASIIGSFILGATLILFAALLITTRWKISLHLIAGGGIAGFLLSFSLKFQTDILIPLILVFLLSGIVAAARLVLSTHKPSQIYTGFLLGFTLMFLTVYYF